MAFLLSIAGYIMLAWAIEPLMIVTIKFLDLVSPKGLRYKK